MADELCPFGTSTRAAPGLLSYTVHIFLARVRTTATLRVNEQEIVETVQMRCETVPGAVLRSDDDDAVDVTLAHAVLLHAATR